VGHPPIARLGKTPRREVGRPGCGSPAARLGEDNARLRPPSCPTLAVFRWRRQQFRQLGFNDAEACELAASEAEPGRARYLLGERLPAAHLAVPWRCPPIRQPSQRQVCGHSIKADLARFASAKRSAKRAQKRDLKVESDAGQPPPWRTWCVTCALTRGDGERPREGLEAEPEQTRAACRGTRAPLTTVGI
jgi:hypothetical protein